MKASWRRRTPRTSRTSRTGAWRLRAPLAVALLGAALAARADPSWHVEGGEAARGPALIAAFGCSGCHTIPGIPHADANVGPPLTRFADRTYIAGMLRNTPPDLVRWLMHPQSVVPGNAMPEMGITQAQARDIAAYLYTLH